MAKKDDEFNIEDLFKGVAPTEVSLDFLNLARVNWQTFQAHLQAGFNADQAMGLVIAQHTTILMYGLQSGQGDSQNE